MPIIVTPVYGGSYASVVLAKGSGIYETAARSTTLNVPVPTERLSGDLLMICTMTYTPVATPSGWKLESSNSQGNTIFTVFTKVSVGSETQVTLTMNNSDMHTALIMVFSNNSIFSKAAYYTGGSGPITSTPVPAVDVAHGSYIVGIVHGYGSATSGSFTWPSGPTEFVDRWSPNNDTYGNYNHTTVAARFQVPEGTYGPWSVTATEAAYYTAASVVITPNLQ